MTTGLALFDRTVQETNLWLKDLEDRLLVPRPQALAALRATMHVLRDRLPPETALHFADQLPLLLRGMFVEGWSLAGKPTDERSAEAFANRVREALPPAFPVKADEVARIVFQTIRSRMDLGLVDKVRGQLPKAIQDLWFGAFV